MINKFEANNFDQEVMNSSQPVMVDFWAPWCTYCRALEPALEEFAQDTPDLKIGKVNVDEEPELARQFNIRTIPTVLLIQNGKILEKKVAPAEVEDLEEMVDSL
ncbi:MAG: thioredoxin [Blautia sp.]